MINIEKWLNVNFESSTTLTPQFASFAKQVKSYIKNLCSTDFELINWSRGHFYISGFLKNLKTNKLVYFSSSDVRYFSNKWYNDVLIRTASNEKDYTGGPNNYTILPELIITAKKLTA